MDNVVYGQFSAPRDVVLSEVDREACMRDMIFVAMENWDGMWRRNQPLAMEFARRAPDHRILFVGLSQDLSHALRKGRLGTLLRALTPSKDLVSPPGAPNIFLLNPVKWLPNTLRWGRAFNRWVERLQIRAAAHRLGLQRPLLWMNPHYALHLVGRVGECGAVYDIGDDWTEPDQKEWLRRFVIAEDAELCRKADAVIVVSEKLEQMKRPLTDRLYRVPNGVYADRYAGVAERSLPPHPLTAGWAHPILGYTGTLHAGRVDIDLIIQLARRFPEGTVALIGPSELEAATVRRLMAEPNIRMTGPVPFNQVPQVMAAFDVCIVPHLVTAFTESLSPLKLYEYLASGLPTVSTPVSGFRDFPDLVYLAEHAEAFAAAARAALTEAADLPERRRQTAAQHTWEARVDEIERIIAPVMAAPDTGIHPREGVRQWTS